MLTLWCHICTSFGYDYSPFYSNLHNMYFTLGTGIRAHKLVSPMGNFSILPWKIVVNKTIELAIIPAFLEEYILCPCCCELYTHK